MIDYFLQFGALGLLGYMIHFLVTMINESIKNNTKAIKELRTAIRLLHNKKN